MGESLWKISSNVQQVIETGMVLDEETGEIYFDESDLDSMKLAMADKTEAVAMYSQGRRALAKARRDAAAQMVKSAKMLEAQADKLDEYAIRCVEMVGGVVETPAMTIKVRNCPPSVEVYDEDEVPNSFMAVKTDYKPDKKAIKEAILNGDEVPGARVVYNRKLEVR